MSARSESELIAALEWARARRAAREVAEHHERSATVMFMDEALHNHWSWKRIGGALGVTDTAARRYYQRNRRLVRAEV